MEVSSVQVTTPGVSLDDFPDEILLEIMRYLSVEELAATVCKVCTRWDTVCRDHALWANRSFFCDRQTELCVILQVISVAPVLKLFEVHSRNDARELVTQLCESCKGLKMLHVIHCNLGVEVNQVLERVLQSSRDLMVLNLKGSYTMTDSAYLTITAFKKLISLNLSYCKGLSGSTLREIANECRCLKELYIDDVIKIYDSDIMCMIDNQYDILDILHLDGEDLTDVSFAALSKCTRLTDLQISFCDQMTDRGLLDGVGKLRNLSVLKLKKGILLTVLGLCTFFKSDNFSNLMYLDVSDCSTLDDSAMRSISTSCGNLWVLILHWCSEVTDEGVRCVVSKCRHLRKLDLLGVLRISGTTWLHLVPFMLPQLAFLGLEQCGSICDDKLMSLVSVMPSLCVINYYGDSVADT